MSSVILYTTRYCPYCIQAKKLLDDKGAEYTEIAVDHHPELRSEMTRKSGQRTVPQIWIAGQHVGGCNELYQLEQQGQLDELLNKHFLTQS